MPDGQEVWIAKPSLTNQALAVAVFDSVQQLRNALEAAPHLHEWVLQRCVPGRLLPLTALLLLPPPPPPRCARHAHAMQVCTGAVWAPCSLKPDADRRPCELQIHCQPAARLRAQVPCPRLCPLRGLSGSLRARLPPGAVRAGAIPPGAPPATGAQPELLPCRPAAAAGPAPGAACAGQARPLHQSGPCRARQSTATWTPI